MASKGRQLLARGHAPEQDRIIRIARGQRAPIRREGHTMDVGRVPLEFGQRKARNDIP